MLSSEENVIRLSTLGHTWILDLDGTIVKHNGYKIDGEDTFLDGAEEFLKMIPKNDMIVFLTSRKEKYMEQTIEFLKQHNIHYDAIIGNAPYGERIVINDDKPTGLQMAYAINTNRDVFMNKIIQMDDEI